MISQMREEVLTSIISGIPVGRLGQPQDIAEAVAFLASPTASFITGANIDINGGQYM
jgi:acetoacetyl-CoA reductase